MSRGSTVESTDASAVWQELYGPLSGFCAAMLGDPELARDIASEAFIRLLSRWRTVRDPRGFLYVTATNLIRDHWRREQRAGRLTERLRPDGEGQQAPDREREVWLRDLVARLPARLRGPVLLHYYADLPVAEVARLLHRPQGTVKRSLHEARTLLAETYQEVP